MLHAAPWLRGWRPQIAAIALGAAALCSSLMIPGTARAQADPADASTELFREGRQLLNEGRFAQACEKFRESVALRRSPGTLLNVGNCLESEGQLLAALETFTEARSLAASEPDARKAGLWTTAANDEIAAVEARIPRITVNAADPALHVTLDGRPLAAFGQPLRVNPGRHRMQATADGKQAFDRELELPDGQSEILEIPPLAPLPAPALSSGTLPATTIETQPRIPLESAARTTDAVPSDGAPRVWPWVMIGVGAAVFAGGAVTGIVAADMESDLKRTCPMMECVGNLSPRDRAYRTAIVADVLMLSGLVTAGVGTAWLLLSDDDSSPALVAGCNPAGCEAQVSGSF